MESIALLVLLAVAVALVVAVKRDLDRIVKGPNDGTPPRFPR